jgi:hypothetical protein
MLAQLAALQSAQAVRLMLVQEDNHKREANADIGSGGAPDREAGRCPADSATRGCLWLLKIRLRYWRPTGELPSAAPKCLNRS